MKEVGIIINWARQHPLTPIKALSQKLQEVMSNQKPVSPKSTPSEKDMLSYQAMIDSKDVESFVTELRAIAHIVLHDLYVPDIFLRDEDKKSVNIVQRSSLQISHLVLSSIPKDEKDKGKKLYTFFLSCAEKCFATYDFHSALGLWNGLMNRELNSFSKNYESRLKPFIDIFFPSENCKMLRTKLNECKEQLCIPPIFMYKRDLTQHGENKTSLSNHLSVCANIAIQLVAFKGKLKPFPLKTNLYFKLKNLDSIPESLL